MQPQKNNTSIFDLPKWKLVLIILILSSLLVFITSLALGNIRYISNLYFYCTLLLFIIAVIPIVLEIASSARIASKAIRKDQQVSEILKEKQKTFERRANVTYAFGISGIGTFLLSIITSLVI
jgi:amino acid transporter